MNETLLRLVKDFDKNIKNEWKKCGKYVGAVLTKLITSFLLIAPE